MKTVCEACTLQENALEINVGDQIAQIDLLLKTADCREYFKKTFITEGMQSLLSRGMARLAGKTNDCIFHLKQAMGGGKTHIMVGFGLLAKDPAARAEIIPDIMWQSNFHKAKAAVFNGRNTPNSYFWGEIAAQLGKERLFAKFWESGAKAPDENAWLELFSDTEPILILLDELPPYFQYYNTQPLGGGTVADVVTAAFANMLAAAQKKQNVCIVISDLNAAYADGANLIHNALNNAKQELGRAEINITPVNLESGEIYEILRKRLFTKLPAQEEITEIANAFSQRLTEAAKARSIERSAEALSEEIAGSYPFHPSFKNIVALFKDNEKFKQTRGLMELVSRLLKSVWKNRSETYLIGAQHFDLSIPEVREKLAEISDMRDVIAKDLWDTANSAHAQIIDLNRENNFASQIGTLVLTSSLSTAVNAVKGLAESEIYQYLISPAVDAQSLKPSLAELAKSAWYMHQTPDRRFYFDRQENLTKKLEGYAKNAPQNKVEELIKQKLTELFAVKTKEAYEKILPLPTVEEALAAANSARTLLIITPDGKSPPEVVNNFFNELEKKNNLLVLTGNKTSIASIEDSARQVYAAAKASKELSESHPQFTELRDKIEQYETDFLKTILSLFDKLIFPGKVASKDVLRSKTIEFSYIINNENSGEAQIIKALAADPIKLYLNIEENFDALRNVAEKILFGSQDEVQKITLSDGMKMKTDMPWLPPKYLEKLIQEACQRGLWEQLPGDSITRKPKPKQTKVIVSCSGEPDENGFSSLSVDVTNGGPAPRIHYSEDSMVTDNSPVLTEKNLTTKALRVWFMAVDPSGMVETGEPVKWESKLVLRNRFDKISRTVELFVSPRGNIKYTLDGTAARNGKEYTEPFRLSDRQISVYAFAECEGLEVMKTFSFQTSDAKEPKLPPNKPAVLSCSRNPKRIDSAEKLSRAIPVMKEKEITLECVNMTVGSDEKTINLSFGAFPINGMQIEEMLAKLSSFAAPNPPVIFTFQKAHFRSGSDLTRFCTDFGIEIKENEASEE